MRANDRRPGAVALKYHPDRNPGKELEFISKFQAIQAAHDILDDPLLRSKYDSDRMRAGMLHTYTSPSPSRPSMPPRSTKTNFPPPPSRAPPSASKSNFPPPPPGASRYSTFPRSEAGNSWNGASAEDAKAKTNNFKAWEQMRHEQGPIPRRNMQSKASTFSAEREAGSGIPEGSMPKRPAPDRFSDPYAESPGTTRSKTTRLPKKSGFAPATPGGDEPQAQRASAYFNVSSRGERPPASRANTHFPPPPSRSVATPKKSDPLHAFANTAGPENPFAKSGRVSTPYATAGGERTYLSSQGLGRSTSWREGRRESEWYDSESKTPENVRPRATSARPNGKRSASPKMANGSRNPPLSSSSSSSSSSDESVQTGGEGTHSSAWRSKEPQRKQARDVANENRRPRFKPSVKVEDVEDEDRRRSGHGDGGYGSSGDSRKRHAADQNPQNFNSDYNPEGFMQHRMKREAERQQRQSSQNSASRAYTPPNPNPTQRPLQRPRSWHNGNRSAESVNGSRSHAHTSGGDQNDKVPMYDPFGNYPSPSTPSSNKWSDQWPFNSPKKPRTSTTAPPPYWAIPSSLAPPKQPETRENLHKYFRSHLSSQPTASNSANTVLPNSFTFPENGAQNYFKPTPPLRSHSSETINLNFSPSEWHGKFTGSTNEYFVHPPPARGSAARGRVSPAKNRNLRPNQPLPQQVNTSNERKAQDGSVGVSPSPTPVVPPPPPSANTKYSSEQWAQHFNPATFAFPPPPPGSPARGLSRKRPMAPRKFPKAAYKRQSMTKPASVSADVHAEEDPEVASAAESLSSKTSGGESPMDIDPALTPPSTGISQEHRESKSPSQPSLSESTPRPPVPPRAKNFPPANEQDPHMNLGELKNVAPFAPSHEGLSNLNDLASTLPFEARASKNAVEDTPHQPLLLPKPPKAPPAPVPLTQTSWERYLAQMCSYMFEWNTYNTKMLNHFNDRQASVENTLKPEWMSAIGEGTEKWGFKAYMQGVEEDFRVREHWDLSWEKHLECMKALGGVRERLLGSSVSV